MDTLDLRQSVLNFIKNKAGNKFLRLVNTMTATYQDDVQPISIEQYNEEIDEAIAEIERGDFYTQDEVEKMAKGG